MFLSIFKDSILMAIGGQFEGHPCTLPHYIVGNYSKLNVMSI